MSQVTSRDYLMLQDGLRDLYAHHDLDTLPRTTLKLAGNLVPNDLSAFNEVDPHRRRLNVVFEPADRTDEFMTRVPTWEKYMHQHPVLAHFLDHPAAEPRRISDFLTDEEFRRLDLYTKFYHSIGCNYQIAVAMPSPNPLTMAIAANREDRDFSERDRQVLALLQPHLRQAYENAALITDLSVQLGAAYETLDRIDRAVVVIDERGRVEHASPAAARYSAEHFAGEADAGLARKLPDTLRRWALTQVAALRQDGGRASRPAPLILERNDGRLVIRAATDHRPGRYLLIMHRAAPLESSEPLEGLGLTPREAEALYGVVEGKSSPEIAAQLGISERTVHKHLENTYRKLGVPGRGAAIAKALEWVRL